VDAQFTRQDTLRGSNTPQRSWWDVQKYNINVTPDYNKKTLNGDIIILYKVVNEEMSLQIDLQKPMTIDTAYFLWGRKSPQIKTKNPMLIDKNNREDLLFSRNGNVFFVDTGLPPFKKGNIDSIQLIFSGKPVEAKRPPWDGGWIFTKDTKGRPWMSVACQGLGASVWYPCKDYQGDEPDLGATLTINVPDSLVAVANGRLVNKKSSKGITSWTWHVKNPINNYNIIPYIGKYVNWTEVYEGEKGKLECSYWVLDYNLEKAKEQLVEAPHLGMEHQRAVAYGNGFQNGYRGTDLSGSGWGLKWDFIIVHEVGHEWFGNNITTKDIADMWVHEGFTNYSETLFTEYYYGKEAGNDYCIGTRKQIQNDKPIIGPYGVNKRGSGDMYYKGGNMLHTIRHVINDDEKFRGILRGLNSTFYHKTITTKDVEDYMSKESGKNLRTTMIPVLEYKFTGDNMYYRWNNCVKEFDMPVKIAGSTENWLKATTDWKNVTVTADILKDGLKIDRNFYINVKKTE